MDDLHSAAVDRLVESSDPVRRTPLLSGLGLQLALLFLFVLAAVWIGIFSQLHYAHRLLVDGAERERNNLARAFAEQVTASIRGIDLSLLSLREQWRHDKSRFHDAVHRQQNYFVHEVSFQVGIIREDGMLVYSSLDPKVKPMSLADREHFRAHVEGGDTLYISKPLFGRVSNRWSIQFTRPILDAKGRFDGVIVMSIDPEYFSRFYDTLSLGENSSVTLAKNSGEILSRSPNALQALGKTLAGRPFNAPRADVIGSYRASGQIDGMERLYTWRKLNDLGVTVIIGEAVDSMLAEYYEQRRVFILSGIMATALLGFFAYVIVSGMRQRAKVNKALAQSEARSRLQVAALEAVGNGVVITDTQAAIQWVNPAFESLTGYGREATIGRHPSELVSSGLQPRAFYETLWRTILSGRTWRGELVNRRADGSLYDEELVIAPVKDVNGEITHFVGVKQDISERRNIQAELQESHDLLAKLSAQVPGVIYQYRLYPDGRSCFPFASQALCDLYGVTPEQVRQDSAPVFAHLHPDDAAAMMASIRESARTLSPWLFEFRVLLGRTLRWHSGSARPERLDDGSVLWHGFITDITARREDEQALRASQERWKFALEGAGDAVWQWNLENGTITFSKRLHDILGVEEGKLNGSFENWMDTIPPEDRERVRTDISDYIDGAMPAYVTEHRVRHKDGSWRWLLARGMAVSRDASGKPLCMVGTQSDITDRKMADEQLRIAAAAFELQEGMMVTDADGIILRVNRAFEEVTGYAAGEVIGRTPAILRSDRQDPVFYQQMWQAIAQAGYWQGEIWNRRKNGDIYPEWLVITAVKDNGGAVTHYVAAFSDITLRKKAEAQIFNLAFYDPLTGLPNRRLLMDRAGQALVASARSKRFGAMMLIDLDHFKTLNDTWGHDVGDQLLIQVAHRLIGCVRERDTVARLGGDEFVVLLEELNRNETTAAAESETVAAKIVEALNKPYALRGLSGGGYHNTPSVGICNFRGRGEPVEALLKHADIALYQAKDAGRNTIRFYNTAMQLALNEKAAIEAGLREALADHSLFLHYQPLIDQRQRVIAAEALLRWNAPGKGMVPPAHFIPVAEETGLILQIGQWVMEQGCAQLAVWANTPGMEHLVLGINVSARQFRQPDFVGTVRGALESTGANPRRLKIELTESMVLADIDDTIAKMEALREIGVRFAIDDFGTGYASLTYLKRLPVDQLKIDQSFIHGIASDPNDAAIVQTIINMSRTLKMEVVAEGVEQMEQHAFLKANSCTLFQGFLFGRPMPLAEFEALLHGADET